MVRLSFALGVLALAFAAHSSAQDRAVALAAYRAGKFAEAIPLLREASNAAPADPLLQAAFLSSLTYEGKIYEAMEVEARQAAAFPDSPDVLTARGEFAFYNGDMGHAEKLFRSATALKPDTPRAVFGLSRLYRAASYYRTARLFCLKAHELDPDDALVMQSYIRYAAPAKRKELLGTFAASHPWLYQHFDRDTESDSAIEAALGEKKLFETEGSPQETTLHFSLLFRGAHEARGVGLELRIGGGRPLHVLFDTGASGIMLRQSAVDKAGLAHLGSNEVYGVGSAGSRNAFSALAETCQIGTLHFKNCLVSALEGKRPIAGEDDGLIGADFFQDYVVAIDFQKRSLHLKPLPPRPANPQGYDRAVPPDETAFTPVYRFGHMLMISTKVNQKSTGLFLLDTGAEISNIDSTFARLSTKIRGNDWMRVGGVSGKVAKVYEADKAELQFGHFRQETSGLIAFDLNNGSFHSDVRMSGILGLTVLQFFRLTIDYRNGLVDFDYILK